MYYLIEDHKLKEWGDILFSPDCKEIAGITMDEYNAEPYRLILQDDVLVENPEYATLRLNKSRLAKYNENDVKAEEARTSKEFNLILQDKDCLFDTKTQTQTDLLTAFAVCSQGLTYDGWVCNNGVVINLTLEDVTTISIKFKELSNVYPHWNYYRNLIESATTYQEVEAIEINYNINLEEDSNE